MPHSTEVAITEAQKHSTAHATSVQPNANAMYVYIACTAFISQLGLLCFASQNAMTSCTLGQVHMQVHMRLQHKHHDCKRPQNLQSLQPCRICRCKSKKQSLHAKSETERQHQCYQLSSQVLLLFDVQPLHPTNHNSQTLRVTPVCHSSQPPASISLYTTASGSHQMHIQQQAGVLQMQQNTSTDHQPSCPKACFLGRRCRMQLPTNKARYATPSKHALPPTARTKLSQPPTTANRRSSRHCRRGAQCACLAWIGSQTGSSCCT